MSPDITWRNGGPLMVGGQIGGSERCCCESPPPPGCGCPDFCAYQIAIVSPTDRAVASGFDCFSSYATTYSLNSHIDSVLDSVEGVSCPPEMQIFAPCGGTGNAWSAALANPGVVQLFADATFGTSKHSFLPSGERSVVSAVVRITVRVSCGNADGMVYDPSKSAPYGIDMAIIRDIFINQTLYGGEASGSNSGAVYAYQYFSQAVKHIDIGQESCTAAGAQSCGVFASTRSRVLKISLPPDFSVSPSTTSLGAYDSVEVVGQSGPVPSAVVDAVGALPDLATFRITSRPACNDIPADCEVPIEGRVVYFPRDGVAVYAYEFGTPKTDVYDFGAWEFAHDGVANGTAESPYVFNAKKFAENPAGFILEEHNLEVFCALDDTVTPPVSRWYVREFVYCTPEFGRQTTDQWISEIPSYPEPARDVPCEGVNAGDPVPVGSPSYQRVDGYPIVDFGDPCDPPPPIGLQITDGCS